MTFILKPSTIENAGIGVFTLETIPANTKLTLVDALPGFVQKEEHEIPDDFLKFCPLLPSGKYLCPYSFHQMNVFWYLNHSNTPNLDWTKEGFITKGEIEQGDELTVFYPDLETHPKNKLWNQRYVEELRHRE